MKKEDSAISKIGKAFKNIFIKLFGTGKQQKQLEEELLSKNDEYNEDKHLIEAEIISPTKQIFLKFIRNKIAITGLIMFLLIILFISIGSSVITFKAEYMEPSQQFIEPGFGYTKVPRALQKEGIKIVDGNYLIDGGAAFTVAISNKNKIYVWGANIDKVKKIPKEVLDNVENITQLAVGARHVVVLTKDGQFFGWGNNSFQRSQIPVYDPGTDSTAEYKKTVEAYFLPGARAKYPEAVVTTIENDPIKKIYAGDQFTIILTEQNKVYAWGVVRPYGINEGSSTYNVTDIVLRYTDEDGLRWRYTFEKSTQFDLEERLILTRDQIIEMYDLEDKKAGDEVQIRLLSGSLQHFTTDSNGNQRWLNIPNASYNDILNLIDDSYTSLKVVDVHILYQHILYELSDNRFLIYGFAGVIIENFPSVLRMSAEERGYRIEKFFSTDKNAFYIDSNGRVFGWGESTSENPLNNVYEDFKDIKIVDGDGGTYHITLLDDKGNVYTVGYKNDLNQLDMPDNIKASKKVVANYFISYAIENDGTIRSWGNNGYLFGTDSVGADVFKRIIAGGTMTLSVAAVAVVISLIIGLTVGLISGFYGKWVDNLLMRFGEIISAFPFLPLALTLSSIIHTKYKNIGEKERVFMIMFILGLLSWPGLSRLVRGQILAEREKDYILAAKALGVKEKHIILRHILPNVINVVIVNTTLSYAGALLTESGLSFLGFGVMYPQPSWGNMLTGAQKMETLRVYWWLWIIPAFFIIMTALSINLIGDGLREAMDPKSNER